jgi:hypothetical protein
MTTMAGLDPIALALRQATEELSNDGRPSYLVHGKLFCCHRGEERTLSMPRQESASTKS